MERGKWKEAKTFSHLCSYYVKPCKSCVRAPEDVEDYKDIVKIKRHNNKEYTTKAEHICWGTLGKSDTPCRYYVLTEKEKAVLNFMDM